ncbi:MAG TPA: hypothetical protein V6C85_38015 [Allocoleopsis sp.]
MPYSQFSIDKVKQDFHLKTVEGRRFFPDLIEPIAPSPKLLAILEDIPWAIAVDTDLKSGLGQCIAEMVAVQRFNQAKEQALEAV